MANILLVTKGTSGDLVPFLGMGSALKKQGHTVVLFTHCFYEKQVRSANLDFVALDTADEFESFIESGVLLNNPQGFATFFQKHMLSEAVREYNSIQTLCYTKNTVIIAHHLAGMVAFMVAEKLGIPAIRLFMAPSQVVAMSLLEKLCERILADDINQIRVKVGLLPVHDWHAWLRFPQLNIAPWPEWFAPLDSALQLDVTSVGFVIYDEAELFDMPGEIQEIVDKENPPILITGGTGIFVGREFYQASAEACHLLGRRGILVTRHEKLIPRSLPEEVTWFRQLPFASIMPDIAAIVHHGGMGSLARAMAAGVPQLALAFGGERPDNARHLQRLGIAEYLPRQYWQPGRIADALHRLINSLTIQERCKDLAGQICCIDSDMTIGEVMKKFLRAD